MAMTGGGGKGSMSDINITPYIDILLVLLIIFMVIQPTTQYDLRARVPEEAPEDIPEDVIIKSDAIVVTIAANGALQINQEPVTLENLEENFKQLLPSLDEKSLLLKADKSVPHGTVVKVMDIARLSGLEKLVIATRIAPE